MGKCLILTSVLMMSGWLVVAADNWVFPPEIAAWSEQVKEQQAQSAVRMMAELRAAIRAGKKEFTIVPGNYRFGDRKQWLPNFFLDQVKDFTIKADGATFWLNGQVRTDGVVLKRCRNVVLRGMTIDCDPFSFSQGEVIAVDRKEKTLQVRLDPGFPSLETWKPGGNMKAVFFDEKDNLVPCRLDYISAYAMTGDRTYQVKLKSNYIFQYNTPIGPGYRLVFPDRSKRMAFNLIDSERVTLDGITVFNAPHMAFTEHGGAGAHRYVNCKVTRRPGTRRLICVNADLFHSIKTVTGPTIENCEFGWSCDDLVNVHGFWSYVFASPEPDEIIAAVSMAEENWAGTELEFFAGETMAERGKAKVLSMTRITDKATVAACRKIPAELRAQGVQCTNFMGEVYVCRLKLDRPLPLRKYDVIQSYCRTGNNAVLRNNYFHDTPTRGLLLRGDGVVIENNRFERIGMNCIQLMTDWYFMEGAALRNLTIRGNLLSDSCFMLGSRLEMCLNDAAISVITCHRNWGFAKKVYLNRNLNIENNRIVNSGALGIMIGNTEDGRVVGNHVVRPFALPFLSQTVAGLRDNSYGIFVTESRRVLVKDNIVEALPAYCRGAIGYGPGAVDCGPQGRQK